MRVCGQAPPWITQTGTTHMTRCADCYVSCAKSLELACCPCSCEYICAFCARPCLFVGGDACLRVFAIGFSPTLPLRHVFQLLDRVFRIMMSKNPNMEQGGTSRLVIRPPQVERLGTRRSAFVNFSTICKQYVSPFHLMVTLTVGVGMGMLLSVESFAGTKRFSHACRGGRGNVTFACWRASQYLC